MQQSTLAELLEEQDQIISRQQALTYLSPSALQRRLRPRGPWQRILPGVCAAFTGTPTERQRLQAALLYAGPGAYVTGATGCRLYKLASAPRCPHVHVAIPDVGRAGLHGHDIGAANDEIGAQRQPGPGGRRSGRGRCGSRG